MKRSKLVAQVRTPFYNRRGISRALDELNISIKLARIIELLPL